MRNVIIGIVTGIVAFIVLILVLPSPEVEVPVTNNVVTVTKDVNAEWRSEFILGCVDSAGGSEYVEFCTCTYEYLDKNYDIAQVALDYQETQEDSAPMFEAIIECMDYLKE